MARDFVYFDLETQKSANDVGGWSHKDQMGMSVGVTYSTALGEYRIFGEGQVQEMIDQLMRADLVIGYNHIDFDYKVLMGYSILDLAESVFTEQYQKGKTAEEARSAIRDALDREDSGKQAEQESGPADKR